MPGRLRACWHSPGRNCRRGEGGYRRSPGTGAVDPAMTRLQTRTRPDAAPVPATAEPAPCRRIILLSGNRYVPSGIFHLEATIFASSNGGAHGDILWTNVDSPRL